MLQHKIVCFLYKYSIILSKLQSNYLSAICRSIGQQTIGRILKKVDSYLPSVFSNSVHSRHCNLCHTQLKILSFYSSINNIFPIGNESTNNRHTRSVSYLLTYMIHIPMSGMSPHIVCSYLLTYLYLWHQIYIDITIHQLKNSGHDSQTSIRMIFIHTKWFHKLSSLFN